MPPLTLKISTFPAQELSDDLYRRWQAVAASRPELGSPFYQPGFARIIAQQGIDLQLAVIEEGGRERGFFPFHRDRWGRLSSAGLVLNDYHGVVLEQGMALDAEALLRACRGRYFAFDHLPLSQATFADHVRFESHSPVMHLEGGIEAYRRRLAARAGKNSAGIFQSVGNARRRLERDHGPLRLELQSRDPRAFQRLIELKSQQFRSTTGLDPMSWPWLRGSLDQVFETDEGPFAGLLSVLYAGDQLVACHLGLRQAEQCHIWFITYDPAFSAYSPGLLLLMGMAEAAQGAGLTLFDLGRGTQPYKLRFQTGAIPLGEGAVSRPAWLAQAALAKTAQKRWLKTTILGRVWRSGKSLIHRSPS